MTRLGVFGSSFNPPTLAHAVLLAEAGWQLALDRIMVVPTGRLRLAGHFRGARRRGDGLAKATSAARKGLKFHRSKWTGRVRPATCDTLGGDPFFESGQPGLLPFQALMPPWGWEWHRPDRVLSW